MAINFTCDGCGRKYSVGDELAGRKARCKSCGHACLIPDRPAETDDLVPLAPEMECPEAIPFASSEPAAVRPSPPRRRIVPPSMPTGGVGSRSKQSNATRNTVGAIVTGLVVVVALILRSSAFRGRSGNSRPSAGPVASMVAQGLPKPGGFEVLADGVAHCSVQLRPAQRPLLAQRLQVFLPGGRDHAIASLPCVFMAPAGGKMVMGVVAGDGDNAEVLPYVRGGFAVVLYDQDGVVDETTASDADATVAVGRFIEADGGVADGQRAISYALANFPEIDSARLYSAGHSSAGTVALMLAYRDTRIRACVAYAPCSDVRGHLGGQMMGQIRAVFPEIDGFADRTSPRGNAGAFRCPILLFHAEDDDVVHWGDSRDLAAARPDLILLAVTQTGGHFDAMVKEGLGLGVAYLKAVDPKLGKGAAPTSVDLLRQSVGK